MVCMMLILLHGTEAQLHHNNVYIDASICVEFWDFVRDISACNMLPENCCIYGLASHMDGSI